MGWIRIPESDVLSSGSEQSCKIFYPVHSRIPWSFPSLLIRITWALLPPLFLCPSPDIELHGLGIHSDWNYIILWHLPPTHTHTHKHMHTHTPCTHTCTYTHAHMCTHTHSHAHTHHTHTCTHTHRTHRLLKRGKPEVSGAARMVNMLQSVPHDIKMEEEEEGREEGSGIC